MENIQDPSIKNLRHTITNIQNCAKQENQLINDLIEDNKLLKNRLDAAYDMYKKKKDHKDKLQTQIEDEKKKIEIHKNMIMLENEKTQSEKNNVNIIKDNISSETKELFNIAEIHKAQMINIMKHFQEVHHSHQPHVLYSDLEKLKLINENTKTSVQNKSEDLNKLRRRFDDIDDDIGLESLKVVLKEDEIKKKTISRLSKTLTNLKNTNDELKNEIESLHRKTKK